jgi:hypothetical protein
VFIAQAPDNAQHKIMLVAYGKVYNQSQVLLDINKIIFSHQAISPDGITLSPEEFNDIPTQLNLSDGIDDIDIYIHMKKCYAVKKPSIAFTLDFKISLLLLNAKIL